MADTNDEELKAANQRLLIKRAQLQKSREANEPKGISSLSRSQKRLSSKCKSCGKLVEIPEEVRAVMGPNVYRNLCHACANDQAMEREQQKNLRREEARDAYIKQLEELIANPADLGMSIQTQLPAKFRVLGCLTDDGWQEWSLPEWAEAYLTNEQGLCLTGPVGVGKTTILCLLCRESIRAAIRDRITRVKSSVEPVWNGPLGPDWRFVSFPKLVMELQNSFARDDPDRTAYSILEELTCVSHLIIDDLGAEKLTEFVRQATYFLLNEREQQGRVTYITTNFSLTELDEQLDSRISSRIAGMCDVKALKGKDRRVQS